MAGDRAGALADLDHDAIIDRIAAGEYSAHIAPKLGVTKQALHYQIRKHPKYREAREIGCELRIDRAMAEFDDANVPRPPVLPFPADAAQEAKYKQDYQAWKDSLRLAGLDLARAEANFKAVAWQAEREFPERWGQKANALINIDLGSALQLMSERMQGRIAAEQQSPAIEGKTLTDQ